MESPRIVCPSCATHSEPDARFCRECGRRLPQQCSCGASLPLGSRFCYSCGSAVESAPRTQGGELRVVTILFADMSGSTGATRGLPPEEAQEVVNALLRTMIDAVLNAGGWVNRCLGDGILAVFGSPRAHEDDPERAISAGLAMREAARELGREVTVGINTGEVYVGEIGSEGYQEVTVMGLPVNLARRLQEQARPGEILVGEATFRQTRGAFEFTRREAPMKGLAEPVPFYVTDRSLDRPARARGIDGLESPLIGRDPELARLRQLLRCAVAGQGQIAAVIGEAGVGKSRLVRELRAAAGPLLPAPLWLEGRCREQKSEAYWPFIDLLRQQIGDLPEDDPGARQERVARAVFALAEEGHLPEERCRQIVPLLAELLSVRAPGRETAQGDTAGAQARRQMFMAVRDYLSGLASRRPVVVFLDDLHWADSLSLDLTAFLAETLATGPALLLYTCRPEREHPSTRLHEQVHRCCGERYSEVTLRDLTPAQAEELLDALLAVSALPAPLIRSITEKSHGNPLVLEEVVRSLIDSGDLRREGDHWEARDGVSASAVPGTVQNLVLSRVDRLQAEVRQVIQAASVIGPVFRVAVLDGLLGAVAPVDAALVTLELQGLVVRMPRAPDVEYSFKHSLTRDAIYETLLRRDRVELHRRVAETIERRYPDRLLEFAEDLARHYRLAGAGPEALRYLLAAAQKARGLYANAEAITYYEQALEALGGIPAAEQPPGAAATALEGLADVLFRTGAHARAEARLRAALAESGALEPRRRAALHAKLADAVHWQERLDQATAIANEGLELLGTDELNPEGCSLIEVIMRSYWAKNDLGSARPYGQRLERILADSPYFEQMYMSHYALAWLEIRAGDFDRALHWLREMERVAAENGNQNGLARSYHGLGDMWRARGDLAQARAWFARSLEYCERTGDAHLLMEGHIELAHAQLLLGEPEAAAEANIAAGMRIAREMAAAGGVSSIEALCRALGDAYSSRNDVDRAIAYYRMAFDFGEHPSPERALAPLRRVYAGEGRLAEFEEFCRERGYAVEASSVERHEALSDP